VVQNARKAALGPELGHGMDLWGGVSRGEGDSDFVDGGDEMTVEQFAGRLWCRVRGV
jgi:hypothetical protein